VASGGAEDGTTDRIDSVDLSGSRSFCIDERTPGGVLSICAMIASGSSTTPSSCAAAATSRTRVGERLGAAAHHDPSDDQVKLVDQPGLDRLRGQVGTAHGEVISRVLD
jgi:hypothetical protein